MAHATLLSNGRIVDGTTRPGWVGDLLIEGDHITALAGPGQIDPAALERLTPEQRDQACLCPTCAGTLKATEPRERD